MRLSSTDSTDEFTPQYIHRWTFLEAITTIAYAEDKIYAGTVSGAIITYDLTTYEEINVVQAHTGSILTLSFQNGLLFSGSCDSLIKVFVPPSSPSPSSTTSKNSNCDLQCLHLIYTSCDIGDIYSLTYDAASYTLYFGTQNASIHWVQIDDQSLAKQRTDHIHKMPAVRPSKFFDSLGPGGKIAPQQERTKSLANEGCIHANYNLIEAPLDNQISFAHHSSIFCMILDAERHQLITGSGDGCIKIWDLTVDGSHKPVLKHKIEVQYSVLSMALASKWQLCCGFDVNGFMVMDLETHQIMNHSLDCGPIISIAAVEDNIFLSSNTEIITYDANTAIQTQFTTSGTVTAILTLPPISSGQLISSGTDGVISLWNIRFVNDDSEHEDDEGEGNDEVDGNDLVKHTEALTLRTRQFKIEPLSNEEMFKFLASIIRFQSISCRECSHWSESRNCATVFRDHMRLLGGESHLLSVEGGNPIVYGLFKADVRGPLTAKNENSTPRILFYGHYDVIEADSSNAWTTHPYKLASINGFFYGRGVADNKGPVAAAIYAVAKLKQERKLSCDVVFAIEGEEESGSFGFIDTLSKHEDLIGPIDWVIFSNSAWLDNHTPCLNYGLRGVFSFEVEISSDEGDLHSGVDGGVHREPTMDMVSLLGKLNTPDGEISVPKFNDKVACMSAYEENLYNEITKKTNVNHSDLLKKWRYPSLTIHQLSFSGPHNKTVIPSKVRANISLRLVPNQTAEEVSMQITQFLNIEFENMHSPNKMKLTVLKRADPWLGDTTNKLFKVMEASVQKVWKQKPLYIREGGSIPSSRALEKLFNAPAAQLPCGQSSDNAHLNDERMRVTNLINARLTFEEIFQNLGK